MGHNRSTSLPHRHRKFKTKLVLVVVVFLALFPALILAAMKLPDSFTKISTDDELTTENAALGIRNLDVLIFNGFIYVGTLFGLLSQVSDSLRRLFLRRSSKHSLNKFQVFNNSSQIPPPLLYRDYRGIRSSVYSFQCFQRTSGAHLALVCTHHTGNPVLL